MEYALITGGSGGIGYALAERLAWAGCGLALCASRAGGLAAAKAALEDECSVPVRTYPVDLAQPGGAEELCLRVDADGLDVSVLVNNAGFGLAGAAEEIDPRREAAGRGVPVCVLCPGATKTDFFNREGTPTPALAMSPQAVAACVLRGLDRNRAVIVPGWRNRLAPARVRTAVVERMKAQAHQ